MKKKLRFISGKLPLLFLCAFLLSLMPTSADAAVANIPDSRLAEALKSIFSVQTVTKENLQSVTELNLSGYGISDLTGLENATSLINLTMDHNNVTDLTPLAGLTSLQTIDASENPLSSLAPLSGLTALRAIHLTGDAIVSLEGVLTLPKLQFLFCTPETMSAEANRQLTTLSARGTYAPAPKLPAESSSAESTASAVVLPETIELAEGSALKINRNGGYLQAVLPQTQASALLAQLSSGKATLRVTDANGNAVEGIVGTGMCVQLLQNGEVKDSLTVIVTGDCNGDGKETVTDMMLVKSHLLKNSMLSEAFLLGADVNSDGGLSVTDFILIKATLLGKTV